MTQMTNFPGGFPNGVTVRGTSLAMTHPGKVFWVDSTAGSNGNRGTYDRPFSTIDFAIDNCTSGKGDIVFAKPGHIETVASAAGLVFDKTGVAVIGLGSGALRPKINLTTLTTADVDFDAASNMFINLLFTGGLDALVAPLDLNAADLTFLNCETRDVTGQAVDWMLGDDNCDRLRIFDHVHRGDSAAGTDTWLSVVGADDVEVEGGWYYGNFAVGAIEQVTTQGNRWKIHGGPRGMFIWTEHANDIAITMKADTTGFIGPNIHVMLQDNAANITECIVAAAMQTILPVNVVNLAGEASMVINTPASTDA